MYGFLQRFCLSLLSNLSVMLVIFQISSASAVIEKKPLSEACEALLKEIPNSDLIYDWNKHDIALFQQWLEQINSSLSTVTPFSAEQLKGLLVRISHSHQEQMQLRQLLDPTFEGEHTVLIQKGHLGEWEQPIYDWLNSILQKPVETRAQIKERQKQYEKRGPLNPIQTHRYEKLVKEVAELEAEIGQKVTTEDELKYAALENHLTQYRLSTVRSYRDAKISSAISILDLKNKLRAIDSGAHSSDRFRDIDGLTAQVAAANNPEIFAEIDFYFSLVQSEKFNYERAQIVRVRFASWYNGKNQSFQDSVNELILNEVQKMFEIHSTGGLNPHYMGPALLYSIGQTVGQQTEELGLEAMTVNLESIDWNTSQVSFLGSWETSTIPRLIGFPIPFEKEQEHKQYVYMYGVEFKDSLQHRRFTVQVVPKMLEENEALPLPAASYRVLEGLKINEIRETLLAPREQDGFQTQPVDLAEPLVELTESSGPNIFRVLPTQLLFSRLPLTREEAQKKKSNLAIAHLVRDAMLGADTNGEYAKVRFYNMNRQLFPDDTFFRLLIDAPASQTFATPFIEIGKLTQVRFFLERNTLNNTYNLTAIREFGFGPFKIKTGYWTGTYQPPRR